MQTCRCLPSRGDEASSAKFSNPSHFLQCHSDPPKAINQIKIRNTLEQKGLVDSQNTSFHAISFKQYALPNQSNPLVLQNQVVPVFKHLFCITVHCFALLNIALLCITLLPLLCFYRAVTTSAQYFQIQMLHF